MTKRHRPGTVKDCVRRLVDEAGGAARVADILDRSPSRVYAWGDPDEDAHARFAHVAALTRPGCPAAAEFLAALAGGVFLSMPADAGDLSRDSAEAAIAFGQFMAATVEALADGRVTPAEARKALAALETEMRVLARLRAQLKAVADEAEGGA